jgi:hypothetical protein
VPASTDVTAFLDANRRRVPAFGTESSTVLQRRAGFYAIFMRALVIVTWLPARVVAQARLP